jgi:TPR repeat protein
MKNPLFLGFLALFLVPPSLASAQSDNADAAYDRKDAAALTRMAEAGDPVAQYNLGFMLEKGVGVKQDYPAAFNWFRKAADQGYADAQVSLG